MEEGEQFYFNEWCFLAQIDPEAFERRRGHLIEEFLGRSGRHRSRLEVLQAAIDRERDQAASPTDALLMLSQKMCGSLWLLKEELKELSEDLRRVQPLAACITTRTWCRSSRQRPYVRRLKQLDRCRG